MTLQGKSEDITSGIVLIQQCCEQLQSLRSDVDEYSQRIFQHSCRIADHSGIVITISISHRQMHRSNPEYSSIEEYYKCVVVTPFLDHLISELIPQDLMHMQRKHL